NSGGAWGSSARDAQRKDSLARTVGGRRMTMLSGSAATRAREWRSSEMNVSRVRLSARRPAMRAGQRKCGRRHDAQARHVPPHRAEAARADGVRRTGGADRMGRSGEQEVARAAMAAREQQRRARTDWHGYQDEKGRHESRD